MKVKCSLCNDELDTEIMPTVVKVVGWVDIKAGKISGNVRTPSEPLGWAHKICVDLPKHANQNTLF